MAYHQSFWLDCALKLFSTRKSKIYKWKMIDKKTYMIPDTTEKLITLNVNEGWTRLVLTNVSP